VYRSSAWMFVTVFAITLASGLLAAQTVQAQTLTTLHSFAGLDGYDPIGALVQATNGDLYGTTFYGGSNYNGSSYLGGGTVFKITAGGKLTRLYTFCSLTNCADGLAPYAGLIQATNGDFYGTTQDGGANYPANNGGSVFKITSLGKLTTLYSFCSEADCADGTLPQAPLIQATNGKFYGTALGGGVYGIGTVFEMTEAGAMDWLYSFPYPNAANGATPEAGLLQANDGNFYGTTINDGTNSNSAGTIFEITPPTPPGTVTSIYSFCSLGAFPDCTDGASPEAALIQDSAGNFYGTTYAGAKGKANVCPVGCGTVFKLSAAGVLTTLHTFQGPDGEILYSGLVLGSDGNLYGTTAYGGANKGGGTLFRVTTDGATFTTLYSFCAQPKCTDGAYPYGTLIQATDGNFYGTTGGGGDKDKGTVFKLSVGLAPFVETQTSSGKVGSAVEILGTDLTGATSVTFNGTSATFTVNSTGSAITTTVPTGATTGTVTVTTSSGVLSSNKPFAVRE